AEAKAEHAELAGTFEAGAEAGKCDRDVLQYAMQVEPPQEAGGPRPVGLRAVQGNPPFHSPEQVRGKNDIAFLGIEIGRFAHDAIDAERVGQQQQAGTRTAFRQRHVAAESLMSNVDPATHRCLPVVSGFSRAAIMQFPAPAAYYRKVR